MGLGSMSAMKLFCWIRRSSRWLPEPFHCWLVDVWCWGFEKGWIK